MGLEFELPSEQLQLSDQVPILKLLLKQLAVSQASIAVDGATSAVMKLPFELHKRTMRLNFRLFFYDGYKAKRSESFRFFGTGVHVVHGIFISLDVGVCT